MLKRAVSKIGKGRGGKERGLVDGGTTLIENGPASMMSSVQPVRTPKE